MAALHSTLDTRAEDYLGNQAHMQTLVDDLRSRLHQIALGGDERAREKHTNRGKLLPRERVRVLLDDGSPFLEIAPLAALGLYED